MATPLNPNAQAFRPEKNTLAITTFGLFHPHPHPQPLPLLPLPPLSQAWPAVPAAFRDVPNYRYPPAGSYGEYFYDSCSQPEPVYYGLSNSEQAEMGFQKLKGVEVYETFGCGERVERGPRCQVRTPRISYRKPTTVNCREKVWIPKKDGKSGGVRHTVHEITLSGSNIVVNKNIPNEFQRGKSWKKNSDRARIIPFPATVDEFIRSKKTTVMIKNIPHHFKWALSLSLSLSHTYIYISICILSICLYPFIFKLEANAFPFDILATFFVCPAIDS
jgi:hypothetical protein